MADFDSLESEYALMTAQQRRKRASVSLRWYLNQLKTSSHGYQLIDEYGDGVATVVRSNHRPYIGGMYQFLYDAKTKDKLPYWDAFPLVIPIHFYSDGFLGLNLHYLPVKMRLKMLAKLMTYRKRIKTGGHGLRVYMELSYKLLTSMMNMEGFQFMIKRYLNSQIRSRVILVSSKHWEDVAFLPTQQFQKQSAETVWAEATTFKNRKRKQRKRNARAK